ncbi:hypothetical protein AHiyo4_21820 [Arthrobacter sp. Hiyo4]|nr:hypothetical protein AHiyo4_21820 [Arthrobacter sp. Hiyo4]
MDMAVLFPRRKCLLASSTSTDCPNWAALSAAISPPPAPATTRSGPSKFSSVIIMSSFKLVRV